MNTKLLLKVKKQILKEPRQFYMDTYSTRYAPWTIPNCGTAVCIAGWAVAIENNLSPDRCALGRWSGIRALDLTEDEADRLFYKEGWPKRFQRGRSAKDRARQAAKRIDHFIATKGLE